MNHGVGLWAWVSVCRGTELGGCLRRALVASLTMSVVGCGGGKEAAENPDDAFDRTLLGVQDTKCEFRDRKDRVAILTQGRGAKAPNVRRVYAVGDEKDGRRVLRCREVDTNLDGSKDVVRTYDEDGKPQFEQADSDYDGRIDTWVEFGAGALLRAQFDHNRDSQPDEFKTYSGGHLVRIQRDTNFDGRVDTWEVYEQGLLRRIGTDTDGDERVDQWYRDDTKKSESGVSAAPVEQSAKEEPAPDGAADAEPSASAQPNAAGSAPAEASKARPPSAKPSKGPNQGNGSAGAASSSPQKEPSKEK